MPRSKQYQIKANPINKAKGKIQGLLVSEKIQTEFELGTNTFVNTPNILVYYGCPIIQYRIEDNQNLLSVYLPDADFWPELEIVDNDIIANTHRLWDLEFRSNYLRITRICKEQYFEIDFREEVAKVAGKILVGGAEIAFDHKSCTIGSSALRNCRMENCSGGIHYGDGKHRLIKPNFAMKTPKGFLFPS